MTIGEILAAMHTLWDFEYTELNPGDKTFYDAAVNKAHGNMPILIYKLYPRTEEQKEWAAKAWDEYRTKIKRYADRPSKTDNHAARMAKAKAEREHRTALMDSMRNQHIQSQAQAIAAQQQQAIFESFKQNPIMDNKTNTSFFDSIANYLASKKD